MEQRFEYILMGKALIKKNTCKGVRGIRQKEKMKSIAVPTKDLANPMGEDLSCNGLQS